MVVKNKARHNERRRESLREKATEKPLEKCRWCGSKEKKLYLLAGKSIYEMLPREIRQLAASCLDCILKEGNLAEKRGKTGKRHRKTSGKCPRRPIEN